MQLQAKFPELLGGYITLLSQCGFLEGKVGENIGIYCKFLPLKSLHNPFSTVEEGQDDSDLFSLIIQKLLRN